jgi:hypothetical protein
VPVALFLGRAPAERRITHGSCNPRQEAKVEHKDGVPNLVLPEKEGAARKRISVS